MDWFGSWLTAQRRLQVETYDVDPVEASTDYVHAMITGLFTEVGELAAEIDWKYWSNGRGNFNREQVIGEAVDALHFLGNILLWAGVEGHELTEAYVAKMNVNAERQENGYDALKDKCSCTRELNAEGMCYVCDLEPSEEIDLTPRVPLLQQDTCLVCEGFHHGLACPGRTVT